MEQKFVNIRVERTIKAALDIYIALIVARTGRRPTFTEAIAELLEASAPEILQQARDADKKA